jgi:D-sedoheptulose 7-phosphate isomerase
MKNFSDYFSYMQGTLNGLDHNQLEVALRAITDCNRLFICGNGGSAASADHWVCDYMKGINEDTSQFPSAKAISLTSNGPLVTAIANDIGYDQVFAKQIEYYKPNGTDVLLCLTVSGNSPNILAALYKAKTIGMKSIAFTGCKGGKAGDICDYHVNVSSYNYGIVEDIHMMILHAISQQIRYWNAYDRPKLKL